MRRNILLLLLVIVLTALVFLRPQYGWRLRSVISKSEPRNASVDIVLENQELKAEVAKFENLGIEFPEYSASRLEAFVYSRYPFNFRNELLVDAGESLGAEAGNAVVAGEVLVGRVKEVFRSSSLVQTIFDGEFQTPVRIGKYGVQGLLHGGALPEVVLIPIDSKAETGDIVYTSSSDFPYGLAIGEVGEFRTSSDKLFKEADLRIAYDIGSLTAVSIVSNGQ